MTFKLKEHLEREKMAGEEDLKQHKIQILHSFHFCSCLLELTLFDEGIGEEVLLEKGSR